MFSLTRSWFIFPIALGVVFGCGGERPTTSSDSLPEDHAGEPLGKLAFDGNVTSAVAVARLRQDRSPVGGAEVFFSRSVSGKSADYEWAGTTDGRGQTLVALEGMQAGGYFRAQAHKDGALIGSWFQHPDQPRRPGHR